MAEFDFRPQFDRNGGISLNDRLAANPSMLAIAAQAGAPILEALARRKQMMEREQAVNALSAQLAGDGDIKDPEAIRQGLRSGLFDVKGLMDIRSQGELRKQQAEKAKQDAETKKWLRDRGYVITYDPNGNPVFHKVGAEGPKREEREPARPTPKSDLEVAIDFVKQKEAQKNALQNQPVQSGSQSVTGIGSSSFENQEMWTVRDPKSGKTMTLPAAKAKVAIARGGIRIQ